MKEKKIFASNLVDHDVAKFFMLAAVLSRSGNASYLNIFSFHRSIVLVVQSLKALMLVKIM